MPTSSGSEKSSNQRAAFILLLLLLPVLFPTGRNADRAASVIDITTMADGTQVRLVCDGVIYELTAGEDTAAYFAEHQSGVYDIRAAVHGRGKHAYLSFKDISVTAMRRT